MQVSLEAIDEQERKLTITVPSAVFEKRIKKRLREAASEVRLRGHRRGKASLQEVRRQLGKVIREEVADDMMREYTARAMQREGLEPAGGAKSSITNMKAGGDLEFVVTFQKPREIELGDFSKIVVREPQAEITDEDVEKEIYELRLRNTRYHEVQRPAREGDRITVGRAIVADGVRGLEARDQQIRIMPNQFKNMKELRPLARYAEILTGTQPGDVRFVPFGMFDDDGDAEPTEKDAGTELTVKKVEEGELPELDAEFLSSLGIKDGDVEKLRAMMRKRMSRVLQFSAKEQVKQQLIDAVAAMHDIPLPDARVYNEIDEEKDRLLDLMWEEEHGADADLEDELLEEEYASFIERAEGWPDEPFRAQAEKNVTFDLVLKAVIKAQSLTPDETRVRQRIDELAQQAANPERIVEMFRRDEGMRKSIEGRVLDAHAVEHILAAATIVPVPCSYAEAVSGSITAPRDAQARGGAKAGRPFDRFKP